MELRIEVFSLLPISIVKNNFQRDFVKNRPSSEIWAKFLLTYDLVMCVYAWRDYD